MGYEGDDGMSFDFDKTYYVSGPMTGIEDFNYPAFELACKILRGEGIDVVSPHELDRPHGWEDMKPEPLWVHMMNLCIALIDDSQGIIMLPGWPQSRGAKRELVMCLERDFPVYFFDFETLHSMNGRAENVQLLG